MGKNQSASNLTNIIKQDASGNIAFMSGSTMLMALSNTGQMSGSAPAMSAVTASYADNFTVKGTLTAQTIVSQVVTSSTSLITGSTIFGTSLANTHVFTGSINLTGSLAVVTNGTEFQVNATGVNLGNALTDSHVISGSLRVNPNGLFVSGSGNVGIGTDSPTNRLHLTGDSATPSLRLGSISVGFHWDIGRENASTGDFVFNNTNPSTGTTEKMRVTQDSAAFLRMASGTAGIQFNGDTAAANALDDYEEGTWTPVIRGSGTAGTYELSTPTYSTYTKIGRQVTVATQITLQGSITGGGTGYLQITGLPFTKANDMSFMGAITLTGVDFTGQFVSVKFVTVSPSTVLYLAETVDNGASIDLPISAISAGDGIGFTITYFE
jgi:hypothetical protein